MDSRAEQRFPAKIDVTLVDLSRPDQKITGQAMELSSSGIRILLAEPLPLTTPLKLELAGSSLFGLVVYSNPQDGLFQTGVEITRVLFGENDLSRLMRVLLAEENQSSAAPKK